MYGVLIQDKVDKLRKRLEIISKSNIKLIEGSLYKLKTYLRRDYNLKISEDNLDTYIEVCYEHSNTKYNREIFYNGYRFIYYDKLPQLLKYNLVENNLNVIIKLLDAPSCIEESYKSLRYFENKKGIDYIKVNTGGLRQETNYDIFTILTASDIKQAKTQVKTHKKL